MQIFTGIDIVELARFRKIKNFSRVAEFVLSLRELDLMKSSRDSCQFLASRFALKEAVIKALPEEVNLSDIEILTVSQSPQISLTRKLLRPYSISASLSHSEHIVSAVAVVYL